jgi:chromate reductase
MSLGLCGSLREKSLNRLFLTALQSCVPDLLIYEHLGQLPFFNPDIEFQPNETVSSFRQHLQNATAVVIATPEYAHGVTGVMKNALDWVVGTGEFMQKPTLVVNCSGSATLANLAIRETLSVMEAEIIPLTVPLKSHGTTLEQVLASPSLQTVIQALEPFK